MFRSCAPAAFLAVSAVFVAGVIIQFFLAGLGVFEGAAAFTTHRDFGRSFGGLVLIMLILAIVGRLPRRQLVAVIGIIVAYALQSVYVAVRVDAPVVAALHSLNGALILLLAMEVVRYAWLARATQRSAEEEPTHTSFAVRAGDDEQSR